MNGVSGHVWNQCRQVRKQAIPGGTISFRPNPIRRRFELGTSACILRSCRISQSELSSARPLFPFTHVQLLRELECIVSIYRLKRDKKRTIYQL
jgi:hypothetical protein